MNLVIETLNSILSIINLIRYISLLLVNLLIIHLDECFKYVVCIHYTLSGEIFSLLNKLCPWGCINNCSYYSLQKFMNWKSNLKHIARLLSCRISNKKINKVINEDFWEILSGFINDRMINWHDNVWSKITNTNLVFEPYIYIVDGKLLRMNILNTHISYVI